MDTIIQIIFFVVAVLIVGAGVMVVTVRNLIHSALWLITSFFGVGMLYLLLEAEFLAVSQVLIYVGAVSVLVLFAIMLTRYIANEDSHQLYKRWWVALIIAAVLFAAVLTPTLVNYEWQTVATPDVTTVEAPTEAPAAPVVIGAREVGFAFMQEYLLPFEVAAVLLLVALVGAIVVAYEERSRRQRVLTLAEQWEMKKQGQGQEATSEK